MLWVIYLCNLVLLIWVQMNFFCVKYNVHVHKYTCIHIHKISWKPNFLTVENQTHLAMVTEKERSANEKVMELSTQVASLESQSSHLRQDKAQLTAQLEMLKSKIQVLEDAKHR